MADWRETSGTNHKNRQIALLEHGFGRPYDVTFVVGPAKDEVKAHQLILSLHSPVFEEQFTKENNVYPIVSIEDGNAQDVKQMLYFLYTGEDPKPPQAANLLKYAVQFKVRDLELWCWKTLEIITDEHSAVTAYELAIKYNKDDLRDRALEFILRNGKTILDSDEFLKFTSHNLFKVLASDSLAAKDETQVFNAVLRWGKEVCKRDGVQPTGNALRNVLTDLLPIIRFPVMDKSDFSILVAPLEVLTDKELISVLLYFNVDESKRNEIPPGRFNGNERTWFKPLPPPPKLSTPTSTIPPRQGRFLDPYWESDDYPDFVYDPNSYNYAIPSPTPSGQRILFK